MELDIIVCTYNRAPMLGDFLQSLEGVELPPGVKVNLIIVDNNSSDHTQEIIKGFSDPTGRIEVLPLLETHLGKAHALNKALLHLRGELVAFTDDDVLVDKGWIREMVKAAERYPDYNCFGGRVLVRFTTQPPNWLKLDGRFGFLKSVFGYRDEGEKEVEYGKDTVSATPGGGNMFFRRPVLEENGPFRTDLGPQGKILGFSEDTEFCERLRKRGERFLYIPRAVVYHQILPQRIKKDYLFRWQYHCGRSEVRRFADYGDYKAILGIPRYLIRKFIWHLAGSAFSPFREGRFYHQLRLSYTTGELIEYLRRWTSH